MAERRVRVDKSGGLARIMGWAIGFSMMVWLSIASAGQPSRDKDAVEIEKVAGPAYVGLVVENRRAYDVTVTLTIHARNARITRMVPETGVYAARSRTEAVRVSATDPGRPSKWRYRFHWTKGSVDARHDSRTIYCLPFEKGRTCRVSQGYNGRLSHRGVNQHAVDFAMPATPPSRTCTSASIPPPTASRCGPTRSLSPPPRES